MSAHRVWRLGAEVDTDALAPGSWMQHGVDVIAQHCLEALRPEFAGNVQAGDVVVAGRDFGIGSSREQAAAALRLPDDPVIVRRGFSEFLVASKQQPKSGLVFKRHGLSWKLSGVDLPPKRRH